MPIRTLEETIALYEKFVATLPDVERKGKSMPYTSVNGNMFTFVTKEGAVALRLSADDREAFLAEHDAALCEQHGRVMKEYVVVPDDLLANTRAMKRHFAAGHAYATGLKAKPTTRPKSRTAKKAAPKKKAAKKSPAKKSPAKRGAARKNPGKRT